MIEAHLNSPRPRARLTGVVYALYFATAIFGEILVKGLVVAGNAGATATNLWAHGSLFRSGLAVGLVANAFYIALTALLYELFKPVSKSVSLLAAFFSLVGCAVQIFGGVFQLAALSVLGDDSYLDAFNADQLHAMALLFLKLHTQAVCVGLVFFAFYDLLIGFLIVRSTFLPRWLGGLMMLAGLGWLSFLSPPFASHLSPYVQALGFLAELVLLLWLLVRGVDVSHWQEQPNAP